MVLVFFLFTSLWAQSESDFTVGLTNDGKGVVIKSYQGKATAVRIPAMIQGMPVKEIDEIAFINNVNITSVVIPEGVTKIVNNWDSGSFRNCKNLISVTLPSTLEIIDDSTFRDCVALKTIILPEGLKKLGHSVFRDTGITSFPNPWPSNISAIQRDSFYRAKLRGDLVIPEGITSIGDFAFISCEELTSVTLPSTIKDIGSGAFHRCPNITTVNIPESVDKIKFDGRVFVNSSKLSLSSQASLKQRGYIGN